MSARLFYFANLWLILALDADESMKQMFLPQLAIEAISKKYFGNAKVVISIHKAALRVKIDKNLNFFMSASKFFPNLDA
jgi:tagatose-1,6-bisphosphate aldolase